MYYSKAKKIIMYHRNGDYDFFQVGERYRWLHNSEIIEIEYEQACSFLDSIQLDIYIKYVVKDSLDNEITHEVFLAQLGGDVFIEKNIGKK